MCGADSSVRRKQNYQEHPCWLVQMLFASQTALLCIANLLGMDKIVQEQRHDNNVHSNASPGFNKTDVFARSQCAMLDILWWTRLPTEASAATSAAQQQFCFLGLDSGHIFSLLLSILIAMPTQKCLTGDRPLHNLCRCPNVKLLQHFLNPLLTV